MEYHIKVIIGEDHKWRGVAFLQSQDRRVNAHSIFKKLDDKVKKTLRTRFEYWQSGKHHNKYFHGWDKTEFGDRYTDCFVFKLGENRFYGFLCHPKETNQRYQICILVLHSEKDEHETYEPDLRHIKEISNIFAVRKAVKDYFRGKS